MKRVKHSFLHGIVFLMLQSSRPANTIKLRTSTISALDTSYVSSVTGYRTSLPCDLSPPVNEQDHDNVTHVYTVYLVLWYKEDQGEPLYSYDARELAWNHGTRWSDEFQFGERAYFDLNTSPATLVVDDIRSDEAGMYRCRVDFKSAPTRNTLVNVTLLEPPSSVTILDWGGSEVEDVAGPYTLDSIVSLTCVSSGGDPSPRVTWWRENELVDSSDEKTFTSVVQNTLRIGPLTPSDLGSVYTCTSANNNVSAPVSQRVTIDLVYPPTDVSITTVGQPLVAGTTYVLSCEAAGSRPDPVISWWLASKLMKEDATQMVEKIKDITKSTIYFTPSTEDHGKIIACRAENTLIEDSGIDDNWSLTVYFPPKVNLSFGVPISVDQIKEGQDIFFRCTVEANPKVYKIGWRHKNRTIGQDISKGILISGNSLVLQKIRREQAGNYSCYASNLEGDTQSKHIQIQVKYAPVCNRTIKSTLGANIGANLSVLCQVDAFPPPTSFSWSFNNSKQSHSVAGEKFSQNGMTSQLYHSVNSDLDYGQFYCSASNSEGETTEPCVVTVIPAQSPNSPHNCNVLNQTTELIQVECQPGFDGGLDQVFVLEVVDGLSNLVLANVSSISPHFTVTGLNPGREVKLIISAENGNGKSDPVTLDVFTTKVAQLQVESPVPLQFTPFLGILAGIIATLIILILTVIIVIKIKYKYGKIISGNSSSQSEQDNCNYKSFKFDASGSTSGDKYLKSNDSYDSECSGSPMSLVSDRPLGPSQGHTDRESSCSDKPFLDNHSEQQLGAAAACNKESTQSWSKVAKVEKDPPCLHGCENVTSWTPFLSRNCEESVI